MLNIKARESIFSVTPTTQLHNDDFLMEGEIYISIYLSIC